LYNNIKHQALGLSLTLPLVVCVVFTILYMKRLNFFLE
jgi:hypothetical protein